MFLNIFFVKRLDHESQNNFLVHREKFNDLSSPQGDYKFVKFSMPKNRLHSFFALNPCF